MAQKRRLEGITRKKQWGIKMDKAIYLSFKRMKEISHTITDPRRSWGNKRHELVEILSIALLALMGGADGWEDLTLFGYAKEALLRKVFTLKNGIPSPDTFRRVISRIAPEKMESLYRQWVRPYVGSSLQKQVCIDGKTIRGASKQAENPLHMVSAWVREDRISLGQLKVAEKANEIVAIPLLLDSLKVQGSVVTIDAMGCQKEIAKKIIDREASYMLAVKLNQPTMYEDISAYFDWAVKDPTENGQLSIWESAKELDHDRTCIWKAYVTTDVEWFHTKHEWAQLKSFVMIERIQKSRTGNTIEKAYYISNLEADAQSMLRYSRGHWSIENQLHWMMDVNFAEDKSLIHKDYGPENFSLLRKMAMAILQSDPTPKRSLRSKRKLIGWSDEYALNMLIGTYE